MFQDSKEDVNIIFSVDHVVIDCTSQEDRISVFPPSYQEYQFKSSFSHHGPNSSIVIIHALIIKCIGTTDSNQDKNNMDFINGGIVKKFKLLDMKNNMEHVFTHNNYSNLDTKVGFEKE